MALGAPTHRTEHTGDPLLDRIQANVARLIQAVQLLMDVVELRRTVSLMLAADFTTTAATAQATKLTFAVVRGECWDVEVWGYGACSTTTGMKYEIDCPTGSRASGELESSSANAAVANWTTQGLTAGTLSAATHVGASNSGRPDRINVRVIVGSDGFITLKVASAAAGDTTTLSALSYLRAFKVTKL